jgi:DNA-binding NtrC family response regulator
VQTENLSGKKYSGTGLGLAIVKKPLEMQNGTISVESEPGVGTTMSVSIPYLPCDKSKIVHEAIFAPKIPEHFKKQKILIAADEDFNRFVLTNILDKWGEKYQEAKNDEEAVSLALENHFDLTFMDMRMPKKNWLPAKTLTKSAIDKLLTYSFPGNIRELKSVMELAITLADNYEITNEHIVLENEALMQDITDLEMTLKEYNLRILKKYLDKYNNNTSLVAEKLGIGVATVYRMMKKTNNPV